MVPTMTTRASAIGAPEAPSVTEPCTLAVCCAASGRATSSATADTAPNVALLIVSRMFRFPHAERFVCVRKNPRKRSHRPCGRLAGKAARYARRVGLMTTSTRDDDVALKVQNAANRNLIHAASGVTVVLRPILTTRAGPRKGSPTY